MKAILLTITVCCLLCGCQTTSYKTLSTVAASVDAAMKTYADAVVKGKVSVENQNKVKVIYAKYQVSMNTAIAAARFDLSKATPEETTSITLQLLNTLAEIIK